jgi:hypothetical protein
MFASLMKELRRKIRPVSALILMLPIISIVLAGVVLANPNATANSGGLAIIRGVVRDDGGSPIADATVAIFRAGTSTLLKQVQSAKDGSYLARIAPGTYTVLAVAQGFNPVTLSDVEVLQSAQLTYGFKLERAGSGNTLPEKRLDRNNPKWVRRSATLSRSIYQNVEGDEPTLADVAQTESDENDNAGRKGQTVAETYFAGTDEGNFVGLNFATFLPVNEDAELILAAQTGVGSNAPHRFEVQSKFRPVENHQIRVNTAFGRLGAIRLGDDAATLSQVSLQATDEWKVREGIIFVFGFDYARFVGAGNDSSISPRLGFQYDLDSKTRLRTSFTTQTEQPNWSRTIELEDAQVIFREPVAVEDFFVENGKPQMNKSRRFEIGIERVLDNNSSIDANLFFDATFSRGVGFAAMPFSDSGAFALDEFVGNQRGDAQGFSLVYNRRITSRISTAAGYSLGRGQRLSENAVTKNPAELFENSFFQSFFGQVDADFKTGTNVKTIFRLSPEATVFAIDPFKGRLAIYDPSMSILVTQNLPTLGLPIHAQAVIDARNIFDFHTSINGEDGSLRINGHGRTLRGGILVRF